MSHALLLDASFSAVPIYESLKRWGCDVHVMSSRPQDPLAQRSAYYIEADYSDSQALSRALAETEFDFLVPGCTDVSYEMCCAVGGGRFRGLEQLETLAQLHRKDDFRALCADLALPSPRLYNSVVEAVESGNSIIVKPVDAFSGRGLVTLLEPDAAALSDALESAIQHSAVGEALMEEYVVGNLQSYSAFLHDGKVAQAFSVAEFCSMNPYVVDTSYVLDDNPWEEPLINDVEKIAAESGIKSGLMHLQYIANEDQYWLIELTRRCPGDLYSKLIELSTGYPYADAYVSAFTGRQLPQRDFRKKTESVVRHTVTGRTTGYLESVAMKLNSQMVAWFPLAPAGAYLEPSPGGRVGVGFLRAVDTKQRDQLLKDILSGDVFWLNYAHQHHADTTQ